LREFPFSDRASRIHVNPCLIKLHIGSKNKAVDLSLEMRITFLGGKRQTSGNDSSLTKKILLVSSHFFPELHFV